MLPCIANSPTEGAACNSRGTRISFPINAEVDEILGELIHDLVGTGESSWPTSGGTIWVAGDCTLLDTLSVPSNVHLDFQNHTVHSEAHDTFSLNATTFAQIRNANVVRTTGTGTAVTIYAGEGKRAEFNQIKNLRFRIKTSRTRDVGYRAIQLWGNGGDVEYNTLEDLTFRGASEGYLSGYPYTPVREGILITAEGLDSLGSVSCNFLHNIVVHGYSLLVARFRLSKLSPNANFDGNVFCRLRAYASNPEALGIVNVLGRGNHFEHIDLTPGLSGRPAFEIAPTARDTYIVELPSGLPIVDHGQNTVIYAPCEHRNRDPLRLPSIDDADRRAPWSSPQLHRRDRRKL